VHTRRREPIGVSGYEAYTLRVPYGVCGFIFPWNFPFLLVGWGVAPALAAGNTIVIKPAEDTPLSTLYFARLAEAAGIPPGVVNVVTGLGPTAGAALAAHRGLRRMSFTGSPEVGRQVGEACGRNLVPVKLELGGKGAAGRLRRRRSRGPWPTRSWAAVTLNAGQVCLHRDALDRPRANPRPFRQPRNHRHASASDWVRRGPGHADGSGRQ